MYYDAEKNAMFDVETGALIPLAEGDEIPDELRAEVRSNSRIHNQIQQQKDFVYAKSLQTDPDTAPPFDTNDEARIKEQLQRDHDMAVALSRGASGGEQLKSSSTTSSVPVFLPPSVETRREEDLEMKRKEQEDADRAYALSLSGGQDLPPSSSVLEIEHNANPYYVGNSRGHQDDRGAGSPGRQGDVGGGGWMDDFSLANALQAMEFEIASEMRLGGAEMTPEEAEFHRKENKATKCKRQMVTISTLMCLIQIGMLVAMIQDDGYAPKSENPMYGPSAYTLVRYGAKVAVLIKYEDEWWRLFTPIFLHAGIIHIISNVAIQLRVGGYLELVFGRGRFTFIYLSSGIYGNMLSCIFLPDSVGIGSSGAVLGMLTAWIVWILFRWYKVPRENRSQRNCQLLVVTAAVALTLAFSFTDYVDWAAHFGGAIQGTIAASIMLSREVEHYYLKWGVRAVAIAAFVISYMWALIYMLEIMHPDKEYLELYDQNDDWGR